VGALAGLRRLREELVPLSRILRGPKVRWLEPDLVEVDGQRFRITHEWGTWDDLPPSTADLFVLLKPPHLLDEQLRRFRIERPRNIVEVGIFQGGSAALLWQLCRPERLIGIELKKEPSPALEEFIARRGATGMHIHWGTDQADIGAVRALVDDELGGADLDLVIDDASHLYDLSRATFEALFPRLRPGGQYVIEDWGWAHWRDEPYQQGQGPFGEQPALTNLIFELTMAAASSPDLVGRVDVQHHHAVVTRGPAPVQGPLPLRDLWVARGRPFTPQV
jgi:Methyltransferase domain